MVWKKCRGRFRKTLECVNDPMELLGLVCKGSVQGYLE